MLEAAWGTVRERGFRAVMLAGEPGIGKTRLAREFARAAHEQGATVLAGSCHEETLVPYQPFVEALRHYVACCPPAELAVQVTPRRVQLAAIVPELRGCARPRRAERPGRRAGALPPVRGGLRAAGRCRARPPDGVVHGRPALGRSAEPAAASPPCEVRARGTPLMVLGSFRPVEVGDEHPLAEALAELRRSRSVELLPLAGLGEAEVAELIAGRAGRAGAAQVRASRRRPQRGQPVLHRGAAARPRRRVRLGCGGWRRARQRQGSVAAPPARARRRLPPGALGGCCRRPRLRARRAGARARAPTRSSHRSRRGGDRRGRPRSSPGSRWDGSASPTRSFARRSTGSSRPRGRRPSTGGSPRRSSRRPRIAPTSAPARSPTTTAPPASCARRSTTTARPPRRPNGSTRTRRRWRTWRERSWRARCSA